MKESSTYQMIVDEGRIEQARRMILKQGRIRFGAPDKRIAGTLQAIEDLDRLEHLGERLVTVSSWRELLDTP